MASLDQRQLVRELGFLDLKLEYGSQEFGRLGLVRWHHGMMEFGCVSLSMLVGLHL